MIGFKKSCTLFIIYLSTLVNVNFSIELNDETLRRAVEVQDVVAETMLASKLSPTQLSFSEE